MWCDVRPLGWYDVIGSLKSGGYRLFCGCDMSPIADTQFQVDTNYRFLPFHFEKRYVPSDFYTYVSFLFSLQTMNVLLFVSLVVAIPTIILSYIHNDLYQSINVLTISLIGFLVINILICIWELALYYRFDEIKMTHDARLKSGFYKDDSEGRRQRDETPIIVFRDVPFKKLFSLRTWAHVWADYSRYDVSYTDPTTFGYNIDVGNGHSTFIISCMFLYSLIVPYWSPKVMGIIGTILFYQKFYGTVLYLFAFFNNRRYVNLTRNELIFAVIMTNIVWFIFPLIGLAASIDLIMSESYAIFQ